MPQPVPTVNLMAMVVILGVVASIVAAWIWVVLRISFGLPVMPTGRPRIVPWGPGSVLAAMLVWFATIVGVPTIYSLSFRPQAARPGLERPSLSPTEMMALSAGYNLATLFVVPITLAVLAGARRQDFGVRWSGLGWQVVRGVVAYPLLAPGIFAIMLLSISVWGRTSHPLEDAIRLDKSPAMAALLVLAGVVLAPAAEELIFRGVLLGWLTRIAVQGGISRTPRRLPDDPAGSVGIRYLDGGAIEEPIPTEPTFLTETEEPPENPYLAPSAALAKGPTDLDEDGDFVEPSDHYFALFLANVAVSLVFAALHGAVWPTPIPIFFLSLGLGLLYQRTGGILAPIALHMTFNGVSTLVMFASLGGNAPKAPQAPNPIPGPAWLATELPGIRVIGNNYSMQHH